MKCVACNSALLPRQHRCSSCGKLVSPLFNRIVPAALSVIGLAALVAGIYGGITTNELPQALSVMIPLFLVAIAASYGMLRGAAFGWYLWTVILGLWLMGAVATLIFVEPFGPVSAGLLFWSSVIGIAVLWRTRREEISRRTSLVYAGLNGISLVVALIRSQRPSEALAGIVLAGAFVGQVVWTYSIRVRWWNNIGLGWTGGQIGESALASKDASQQAAAPDGRSVD